MIKGWKEKIKKVMMEVREGFKEQGRWLKDESDGIRRDSREQEAIWKEEREEMKACMRGRR